MVEERREEEVEEMDIKVEVALGGGGDGAGEATKVARLHVELDQMRVERHNLAAVGCGHSRERDHYCRHREAYMAHFGDLIAIVATESAN
ncbi:hypothetical protein KI387_022058, partial [Taxus chinensis]